VIESIPQKLQIGDQPLLRVTQRSSFFGETLFFLFKKPVNLTATIDSAHDNTDQLAGINLLHYLLSRDMTLYFFVG